MTKASITNRIRVTKTGKLIRRKMGLSHCRAKKTSQQLQRQSKMPTVHPADIKLFKNCGLS